MIALTRPSAAPAAAEDLNARLELRAREASKSPPTERAPRRRRARRSCRRGSTLPRRRRTRRRRPLPGRGCRAATSGLVAPPIDPRAGQATPMTKNPSPGRLRKGVASWAVTVDIRAPLSKARGSRRRARAAHHHVGLVRCSRRVGGGEVGGRRRRLEVLQRDEDLLVEAASRSTNSPSAAPRSSPTSMPRARSSVHREDLTVLTVSGENPPVLGHDHDGASPGEWRRGQRRQASVATADNRTRMLSSCPRPPLPLGGFGGGSRQRPCPARTHRDAQDGAVVVLSWRSIRSPASSFSRLNACGVGADPRSRSVPYRFETVLLARFATQMPAPSKATP